MRSIIKKIIFLFTIILVTSYYVFYISIIKENYTIDTKRTIIEINEGFSLEDVISQLSNYGEFSNLWSFKLLSKIKKYDKNIKPGRFKLNGSYKNNDLINILRMPKRGKLNKKLN